MSEESNRPAQSGRGIACMVAGAGLLTVSDAFVKWLTDGYPVGQIVVVRGLFTLIPILLIAWRLGDLVRIRTARPAAQALRAVLFTASVFLFLSGLRFNPLAVNTAIVFASPLIITALATPLLGETIGWRRWGAVLIGFLGVLVMVRPVDGALNLYALLPLAAAVTSALQDIVTRRIGDTESAMSVLLYSTMAVILVGFATAADGAWRMPAPVDLGLLALTGLLSGAAHYLLIETFVLAEAVVVVPFRYTALVWGVLLGYIVWGDLPTPADWFGIALIVASGIYIIHREAR